MRHHQRPTGDLPDVFVGSAAVAADLLTVRQLRGPFVTRVIHGVYRPSWVPLTHTLKCRAACLVLPDDVIVTGMSAACVLGLRLVRSDDEVAVVAPEGRAVPRRSGLRLRRVAELVPGSRIVDGVRVAHPRRVAFDAAARRSLPEATAALDAIVRHGIVGLDDLRTWLVDCRANDVRSVRRAADLVDPRAESWPESITRVHLVEAGFAVVPQYRVAVNGEVIARVDLALPDLKIAVEYDGRWHEEDSRRTVDNGRLAALRAAGWTVIIVTAELLRSPRHLVAAVAAAVSERRSLGF